jgi:polyisoprenyl-phosphate glycosyltransferase
MNPQTQTTPDVVDAERPKITVVIPVYKEEANIAPFLKRIEPILESIGSYEILFCLDPSPDRTEQAIVEQATRNPRIGLLAFSRRFGQPSAVIAGIRHASGESCLVIDVDLQDPPELIPSLYAKMGEGYDVVYAKRRSRQGETLVKKLVSYLGYKVINAVSDVEIPRDTGDFRIMNRRVVEQLRELKEGHGFLRGLVAFVGFRQSFVEYDRDRRAHGAGNYNRYLGSLKIGLNGLVGFSNFLLKATLASGLAICLGAFVLAIYIIVAKFVLKQPFELGVVTIILLVLFMGGVQLVSVGIVGEYVGRIYDEVKERPQYIVRRAINVRSLQREQGAG